MISSEQLTFERYFQPVFEPVSFSLAAASALIITGANGSGKTTLLRLLAGSLTPTTGSVVISAAGIAHIGHLLAIKDDLSVTENLQFARQFYPHGSVSVEAATRRVGLMHVRHQLARTLSAGQRKRCAMARLLMISAQLWLLDEPYSNLDGDGQALIDELIMAHVAAGGACVLATHGDHRPPVDRQSDLHLVQAGDEQQVA